MTGATRVFSQRIYTCQLASIEQNLKNRRIVRQHPRMAAQPGPLVPPSILRAYNLVSHRKHLHPSGILHAFRSTIRGKARHGSALFPLSFMGSTPAGRSLALAPRSFVGSALASVHWLYSSVHLLVLLPFNARSLAVLPRSFIGSAFALVHWLF